ncbi:spore coat protein [Bacillus sp. JJ675]|uniref:spore coat protein n=1 Tax=Bacillus sp. JJ675 TaxID=3122972 RepID=UPI002FFF765E
MSDQEKLKADINPLMSTLVTNILRKHGVSKDNVRTLSEDEKNNILKMLEDLKAQSQAVIEQQKKKEQEKNKQDGASSSADKTTRKRNRSNKNKLREKLKQRRQQGNQAENEEKNGDLE